MKSTLENCSYTLHDYSTHPCKCRKHITSPLYYFLSGKLNKSTCGLVESGHTSNKVLICRKLIWSKYSDNYTCSSGYYIISTTFQLKFNKVIFENQIFFYGK